MNKKLIHLITTKLPIVTLLILILSYAYLSIPNNYAIQVGGVTVANTFPLPKNVPWKYKYRYLLVAIPIMLIIYFINTMSFYNNVSKMTTWNMGKEFFYEFQQQIKNAVQQGAVEDGTAVEVPSILTRATIVIAAVITLVLGVYPAPVLDFITDLAIFIR